MSTGRYNWLWRKIQPGGRSWRVKFKPLLSVQRENNLVLQKRIWQAKAENAALQKKPWQAYAALDSAFAYYHKEVDYSIIGQARELEAKYSLLIQQSLYDDKFIFRISVEGISNQNAILIPPMLLQPFAENTIVHGFKEQTEKGQINIGIKKEHNTLHCIIEDNGRGFQQAEAYDQKRPLSTIINQERLNILSRQTQTPAQLTIVDKKATTGEAGVRVELVIPYQMER